MAWPDLRLCIAREAGERLPPRWYGLAYLDSLRDVGVFYPTPLNYVVRAWRRLLWFWDRWRAGAPRLDQRVRAATRRAYLAGEAAGQERGARHMLLARLRAIEVLPHSLVVVECPTAPSRIRGEVAAVLAGELASVLRDVEPTARVLVVEAGFRIETLPPDKGAV